MDVRVSFLGHSVSVAQSHRSGGSEDTTGWRCWPASAVALRLLASPSLLSLLGSARAGAAGAAPPPFSALSLLDLSAGAGLVSAAASAAGASVTATETASALGLLAANAPAVVALPLYWGAEPCAALRARAPFDAVIACDLVFIALRDGRARELAWTLRRLAAQYAPVLCVWEERRIADEDAFVRALALPGDDGAPPLRCDEVDDCALLRLPKDERLVGLGTHDEGELEALFYTPPPVRAVVLRAQ